MKAIIENFVQNMQYVDTRDLLLQFNDILEVINESNDEKTLRYEIYKLQSTYSMGFLIGFGANHMWVHQEGFKERLLIVEF